jgi:hypothetical protein
VGLLPSLTPRRLLACISGNLDGRLDPKYADAPVFARSGCFHRWAVEVRRDLISSSRAEKVRRGFGQNFHSWAREGVSLVLATPAASSASAMAGA